MLPDPPDPDTPGAPQGDPDIVVLSVEDAQELNDPHAGGDPDPLLEGVPDRPNPRVAVDLGAVPILSSTGVRTLVNLKRRVESSRGRLVLFHLQPQVQDLLTATSLAPLFPTAADEPAALALLRSPSSV